MAALVTRHLPISRRAIVALPFASLMDSRHARNASAQGEGIEREQIAVVERADGLTPPLTLGIARVVLRPGASALAATPQGARMIAVESGVLAIAANSAEDHGSFTADELAITAPEPSLTDELFVPAGTAIAFGTHGVASVRNPGARAVVALDVVVFREQPRPIGRAFTTEEGVSFQLLASASASAAPPGRLTVALERVRLGAYAALPSDLGVGLTLMCVRAGTITLNPVAGNVFSARAAASAPYSMPGDLEPNTIGKPREVTAGGVVFLPVGAETDLVNPIARPADLMTLAVREVD